jgi:ABC-type lipoprotein export system ATPase subunit
MPVLLKLDGIGKSFRRGHRDGWVLRDVSLSIAGGEMVAVVASRGQGKSTLLRIAAGIETPDEGCVRFDGEDLASLKDRTLSRLLREQIGLAGRSGPGLTLPMVRYVEMPLLVKRKRLDRRETGRIARNALDRMGILGCAERRWDELSDWERALAEIAQGIVRQPKLLLIDDVMDGLGMLETQKIGSLLGSVVEETGMAMLISVSDGEAALCCDRVFTLMRGKLALLSDLSPERANVIEFPGLDWDTHDSMRDAYP